MKLFIEACVRSAQNARVAVWYSSLETAVAGSVAPCGYSRGRSGQSLVANVVRTPGLRSVKDLRGLEIGVQHGNTSEPVAQRLRAASAVAAVRVYPYDAIATMLCDLEAGRIAAVMKLAPVMRWLVRGRPDLCVVQEGLTTEEIAVAVRRGDDPLREALDAAQARLAARGALDALLARWIGPQAAGAQGVRNGTAAPGASTT